MTLTPSELNETYAIPDHVQVLPGHEGCAPVVELRHGGAVATVALDGAQVLGYTPAGQQPVIFLSRQAAFKPGKSARGGVPVCWPWFGGVRDNPSIPFHGFARMAAWELRRAAATNEHTTVELALAPSDFTRSYWPHEFELSLRVQLGAQLRLDLTAHNTDGQPVELTAALHTYFRVGEIGQVAISGLDGVGYIDKLDGDRQKLQQGDIRIAEMVDRIYVGTSGACVIDDDALGRRIVVGKEGSNSVVVWNPWAEEAKKIADMADEEYREFVCVETTNAGGDVVTLAPGASHTLTAIIRAEPR